MKHIKTFNNIAVEGLKRLTAFGYILDESENPDAIILRSHELHDHEFNSNLLAVARAGAGTNNIPTETLSKNGVVVFNTPGSNANAVKELVFSAINMTIRNMFEAKNWVDRLEEENVEEIVESNKKQFKGSELAGKTIGVIGLGEIGHLVANDAYALGMDVIGYDPYISEEIAENINQYVVHTTNIEDLLQKSDFVTIHVPYSKNTHHMIDAEKFKLMKKDALLINFARAELVETEAIPQALDENSFRKYLTDFPSKNLMGHPDCILFPHLGASTVEAEKNSAMMAVKQIMRFLEKGEIINSTNFPNIELNFNSPVRISIANSNIPNMIGSISNFLAQEDVNIDRIINKSRGEYAYTLVDVTETDSEKLAAIKENLENVEGILRVRYIYNTSD